jgi:soluble P-type ATPase
MLAASALSIALIQAEGASAEAILHADVIATCIQDAIDLLAHPNRLKATLQS